MTYPTTVRSADGRLWTLTKEPLGRGGQGVVFRTLEDPGMAVKLLVGPDGVPVSVDAPENRARVAQLTRSLEHVRLLDLPGTIHIAQPQEWLTEHLGYTMRLLEDMIPAKHLIAPAGHADLSTFYLRTGSLRRRLQLLTNTARLLADIHGRGITYGDLSDNNLFVSDQIDFHEVWLIDADNMRFKVDPKQGVYTPFFGAPEVVRGELPPSMRSDTYSFALLAFWMLVQTHPFLGEAAEDGGWSASIQAGEEAAERGELSWIGGEDGENEQIDGLPMGLVLSPSLAKLFKQTFEHGRADLLQRPRMTQWADALERAWLWTIACPECESSYYVSNTCPWCKAPRPDTLFVESRTWVPEVVFEEADVTIATEMERELLQRAHVHARLARELPVGQKLSLTTPLTRAHGTGTIANDLAFHRITDDTLACLNAAQGQRLITQTGRARDVRAGMVQNISHGESWYIHCGSDDAQHRYLTCTFHKGAS